MKLHHLAKVLIISYLLVLIGGYPLSFFLTGTFSLHWYEQYGLTLTTISTFQALLADATQIAIAYWLFRNATEHRSQRWIWASLGLFYGMSALILYFLYTLLERRPPDRSSKRRWELAQDGELQR